MKKIENDVLAPHITEGASGTWFYHLSADGTNVRGLCGAKTMLTAVPLSSWGVKGHLNERYCADCQRIGLNALIAAGATIPS